MTIGIGPYTAGEIPPALTYTFLDAAGSPIDLTGFDARFVFGRQDGTSIERPAELATEPATGAVTYTWEDGDLTAPDLYDAEFWVGDGTTRFASERIEFLVTAALEIPAI